MSVEVRMPVVHRSHSQLSSWLRCGEAYRLERIDGAPATPAAWLYQGTAFHTAIEQYERSMRYISTEQSVVTFIDEYDTAVQEQIDKGHPVEAWIAGGRTKPVDDIKRRAILGARQVRDYIAWAPQQPFKMWELPDGSPAVEVPFHLMLDGLEVRGMIDQIVEYTDGTVLVRDLKTGTKLPDSTLQLGTYDLAFESLFDFRPGIGDFYMAKNNAPTKPVSLLNWTLDNVSRAYNNVDRAIKDQVFIPNVGENCGICSVSKYCSALGSSPESYPPRVRELL